VDAVIQGALTLHQQSTFCCKNLSLTVAQDLKLGEVACENMNLNVAGNVYLENNCSWNAEDVDGVVGGTFLLVMFKLANTQHG
jgi:hypothetical protein